ncbi:sulfite exporter TauE/SafE family protein [Elusimicrobiota bacterium]
MEQLIQGTLTGLSVNFFCIGTCLPVLLPFLLSEKRKIIFPVVYFMLGRLTAYILFAVASGTIGIYFNGRIDPLIFSALTLLLAFWLLFYAFGKINTSFSFCGNFSRGFFEKNFPFFAGFVLGVNICPPFLLGLSDALQMKSLIKPIIYFLGFYLGSSLWLIFLLFTERLTAFESVKLIGRIAAIAVGIWYLARSLYTIVKFL